MGNHVNCALASDSIQPNPVALVASCDASSLPIPVKPHQKTFFVPLNARWLSNHVHNALDSIGNLGDSPFWFPSKKVVASMYKKNFASIETTQCDIENHDKSNIISVTLTFIMSDLSPFFHPIGIRARPSFEPHWLGGATGRGAEPRSSSSDPPRCIAGSLSLA